MVQVKQIQEMGAYVKLVRISKFLRQSLRWGPVEDCGGALKKI